MAITAEQNDLLTRVEGDAPMGTFLRENYWTPACLATELAPGGAPRRLRLLGKDYVGFRANDGRIGVFDERCPHRGASLVLGRNDGCALQCIFHAWKFDVTGKVVAVPTQAHNPEEFAARVRLNRYETHEGGGIVWVWLGPQPAPAFPELPFTAIPAGRVWMTVTDVDCNWFQGVEGTLDSAHVGTLHDAYMARLAQSRQTLQATGAQPVHSLENLAPQYRIEMTGYGMDAIALRPMADGSSYRRTTRYIMPYVSLTPFGDPDIPAVVFIACPVDDGRHRLFFGFWSRSQEVPQGAVPPKFHWAQGEMPFDPHNFGRFEGSRDSNWGQDREAMERGHFTGMLGNLLQEDIVVQLSMGAIVDRTLDTLSTGDVAIAQGRRLLLDSVAAYRDGVAPAGAVAGTDWRAVEPENLLIPAGEAKAPVPEKA